MNNDVEMQIVHSFVQNSWRATSRIIIDDAQWMRCRAVSKPIDSSAVVVRTASYRLNFDDYFFPFKKREQIPIVR